jgi:glutamyl-tRNA synthetase
VTLGDLAERGDSPGDVCARLAASIGIDTDGDAVTAGDLLDRFDPDRIPRAPWVLTPDQL